MIPTRYLVLLLFVSVVGYCFAPIIRFFKNLVGEWKGEK